MKKFSIIFSAFVVAALTACTLYMDEPEEEEGRILRTGEGYDKEETITLPNGQGSVTYEYSQKTIPINDEVEQYIVKVESDTILYFEGGTPEELLPEVGEMMTCSFRDRFPNAFCHKCIERTEQNGIYRCVFSKCDYGEAFKVLDVHFDNLQLALPEGGKQLTQEEEDSLFEETEVVDEDVASSRSMRRRVPLDKHVKKYTIPIEGELGVSAVPGMDLAGAKVGFGGEIIIGGWIVGDISFVDRSADFDVGIIGGIGLLLDVQARAGITYKLPVGFSPFGFRFDLAVIGGQLGLTADPYLSVHREVYGHIEVAFGIDCGFHYKRDPNDKAHPYGEIEKTKSGSSKMAGKTPFFYVNDYKESKGFDLNIEAGMDYKLGIGFKIGEGAAQGEFAVGLRTYGLMQQQIDIGEFQSAEDFKQKNANFPTYGLVYVSLEAGVFWVAVKPQILIGPFKLKDYYINIFPESNDKGSVRCVDMKSKWFSADAELLERGLLSYWRSETPKLRFYDKETKKLVGTMDLHWVKEGKQALYDSKKMTGSKKVPEIEVNHEYIAQFALDMSAIVDKALFPLEEVPFHVAKPIVELESVKLIYTQSARNASLEEMANPKLVVSKGSQKGWIYQNKVYNYRYIMDIIVQVKGLTKIGRWGLLVSNNAGRERDVYVNDKSGKLSQKYKVRLHWYTSKQTENLCIQSYSVGLNENGKMTYDREFFDMDDYVFEYNPNMDFVWAQTQNSGSGVDFEFMSRKKDPSDITVHFDDTPDADGTVLGDVEVIPIDD